jgi:hypothetical protein
VGWGGVTVSVGELFAWVGVLRGPVFRSGSLAGFSPSVVPGARGGLLPCITDRFGGFLAAFVGTLGFVGVGFVFGWRTAQFAEIVIARVEIHLV